MTLNDFWPPLAPQRPKMARMVKKAIFSKKSLLKWSKKTPRNDHSGRFLRILDPLGWVLSEKNVIEVDLKILEGGGKKS